MAPVHVRQPTDTSCAQACIAMITGADVAELVARMKPGSKTGTRGAAIVRELRARGVRCGDRFESLRGKPFPRYAIVRIVHPNKRGHVVVKYERTWFDPLLEAPFVGDPPRAAVTPWAGGSRITSSLWLDDGMP
jgi:hypothetical protein